MGDYSVFFLFFNKKLYKIYKKVFDFLFTSVMISVISLLFGLL